MDAQAAQAKFQQADALFRQGQHREALRVLTELNNAFPNSKNVLYPMALCLDRLGQRVEAGRLCSLLVQKFQDARAQALIDQMQTVVGPQNPVSIPGLDAMQFNITDHMPPAFAASTRPAAAPSGGRRKLLIGVGSLAVVLAVVAVAAAGARQGWFAGGPSKIEQIEKKFAEVLIPANSMTATISIDGNMPNVPIPISASGTIEYLERDGRVYLRVEGGASMPPVTMLMVSNGESIFQQIDMQGEKMVMKMPPPPDMAAKANPGEILRQLNDAFDMKSLPDESFRGKNVWVFDLRPKAGAIPNTPMPIPADSMDRLKLSVDSETLSYLKLEALDKGGNAVMALTVLDIRLDAPLTPERFAYTPPEGVKVMDMSQMAGMGGGMLPFMGQ